MKKWRRFTSIAIALAVCGSLWSGATVTAVGETTSGVENPAAGESGSTSDTSNSGSISSDAGTGNGKASYSGAADDTENGDANYEPVTDVSAKYDSASGTIFVSYMASEEIVVGENAKILLYDGANDVTPQIEPVSAGNTETGGTTDGSGNAETTELPKIIHQYEISGMADGKAYTVQLWINGSLLTPENPDDADEGDDAENTNGTDEGDETEDTNSTDDADDTENTNSTGEADETTGSGGADGSGDADEPNDTDNSGNADDSASTNGIDDTENTNSTGDADDTDGSADEDYVLVFTDELEVPFKAVTDLAAVYRESDRAIYLSYNKGNAGKVIILANGEEAGESREDQYKFEIPEDGDGQKYIFHVIACADDEYCSFESAPAISDIIDVPAWRAICSDLDVSFEPETKTVTLEWDVNENVEYVYIELNEVMLAAQCTEDHFSFQYALQPGATYTFQLTPFNKLGEEGNAYSCVYDNEALETPVISEIKKTFANISSNGVYNAFARPAVVLTWDAQAYATYSIYRAKKNSQSSYTWIGRITATKEGNLSYTDKTVGIGKFYYKICQEVRTDTYISQGVATTLSDAEKTTVTLPRPKISAQLMDEGTIMLTLDSTKEYVSGYRIFRKTGNGTYKKIADTSDTVYYDTDITAGKTYYYKAKAYYYNASGKTKTFGTASSVAKAKSTLSDVTLKAVTLSSRKVKLSWNSVANAENYEIYYKTAASGDSYRLLEETKKTALTASLKTKTTYQFMIRACYTDTKGKTSYSIDETEVTLGFAAPQNFRLSKTSYKYSADSGAIRQYDTLKWNRVYGASGYKLEVYHPDTQKYEVVKTVRGGSKTSCTVANTVSTTAQTLTYRISAYKKSAIRRGSELGITVQLGAPTGISVKKTGASSSKVTWKKVPGADSYVVYRSNGRTMVPVGTSTKNSFSDHGVALGTPYIYYVKSVFESLSATSEASEPFAYTSKVAKISSLKAKNTKAGTVTLSWKASSDAGSYVIYCKTGADGTYKRLGTVKSGKKTFQANGLKKDQTYYFKVGAVKMTAGGYNSASTDRTVKIKLTK